MQSNHASQTVAAAATIGLPYVLVLGGEKSETTPQDYYLLDTFFGAEIRRAGELLFRVRAFETGFG